MSVHAAKAPFAAITAVQDAFDCTNNHGRTRRSDAFRIKPSRLSGRCRRR